MKKTLLFIATVLTVAASAQKAQVWDFGAEQLDETKYVNMLTVAEINSWYADTITAGSTGITLGSFIASATANLEFNGAGKTNHRLRTTNTALTCYDRKSLKDAAGAEYTGYIYSNAGSTPGVYIEQTFSAGDKIEYYVGSNGGKETYVFESPNGEKTEGHYTAAAKIEKLTFYAGQDGKHRIYGTDEKLVVARIIRTPALMVTVSGTVTAPKSIPDNYSLVFTNVSTNGETEVTPVAGNYSVQLAADFNYNVSLKNANGYIVTSDNPVSVGNTDITIDITIGHVSLVSITGYINGLPDEELQKLDMQFLKPDDRIYEPEFQRTGSTFSLNLENNIKYKVVASGVNDYDVSPETLLFTEDATQDFTFKQKPAYDITIVPTGATAAELSAAKFTFENLEDHYVYVFTGTTGIKLRDGVYSVKVTESGIYSQLLTSNLRVEGKATSKQIDFTADVHEWVFTDADFTDGGYTNTNTEYNYKTLQFKGCKSHNNTYLYAGNGGEIRVPVHGNSILTVNACYEYHLYVGETVIGDQKTGSTSQIDALTYEYKGGEGFVTISAKGTSYINSISVALVTEYKPVVTVGAEGDYATINEALEAISKMSRTDEQNVTIMIEPGNYEEMLRIHLNNITLKNAAAEPSIEVKNGGVDITDNAVRITSYYGHGYNYYSMTNDFTWDERTLQVNKENGYYSVVNGGGASTTHWNSTVVVYGKDFTAEGIIFENSYNQYISKKESEDVVVEAAGSKGIRPTAEGNTDVQQRKFRERACALAFAKGADRGFLKNCRIIGRQDAIYGDNDVRVAIEGGILNGACDYIFGGMNLTVWKAQLAMLVTSDKDDVAYITASKTAKGKRGYLLYQCTVTSARPEVDMVETETAKPGLWGRPWDANAETGFCYTTLEKTKDGASLIQPAGWNDGLVTGGSPRSYEFGTTEVSGVDNSQNRVKWATVLTEAMLPGETEEITLYNFTKGNDNWNPFQVRIETSVEYMSENKGKHDSAKAQKLLIDGNIYIVRDGKYYTLFGAEVR